MQYSKIIQLLKSLSEKEFDNFQEFIISPFFYKAEIYGIHRPFRKEKILEYYTILKKEYPDFKGDILQDENSFKNLFPGEKYNYNKISGLRHDLLRIVELYLSYIDILEDPIHPKIHLINQCEKRGLDKMLISNIDEANEMMENNQIVDEDHYFQKYLLANKKWLTNEKNIFLGKSKEIFDFFIEGKSYLESSFLILMLKQLSYICHYKHHFNFNADVTFQEYIYNYLDEHKIIYRSNSVLEIWRKSIALH